MKQQMQIGLNHTTRDTFQHIYKTFGIRGFQSYYSFFRVLGFYAGIDSLVLREIPFSAIEFPLYEYMKKLSYEENKGEDLTPFQNARNGAVAGSIGKKQK